MAKMHSKSPLMGQKGSNEGSVVFCPFEMMLGPEPPGVPIESMRNNLGGMSWGASGL